MVFALLAAWGLAGEKEQAPSNPEKRRTEVLFLGSNNHPAHDPPTRFRVIRKALGYKGINFTYTDKLDALTPENLAKYDVLLIFANQYSIDKETQGKALLDFARNGGGCVLLHCAAGCFRESKFDEYVDLLGAQFKEHGTGVFRAKIVNKEHPIMRGWDGFECWDETYVHKRHGEDRTILQMRGDEPWTWVKTYGKGRVFYTASGHDHRCWDLPEYHELVHRAVRWTAGDNRQELSALSDMPVLRYRPAAVPKDPDNPVGPLNEIQHPLPPDESLKLAQVPPGFALKLFASEPAVINPISINWDSRGRLWVVEAYDYPHKIGTEDPQDRIKILEDTDRDGRADKVTVFATGLNICTSVLPVPGGALATDGPNLVFLHDDDGDDQCDRRETLWAGIGLRDTHACVSNLRYGFDGWVYATVGYSGLNGKRGKQSFKSSQGVFRFQLEEDGFEVVQNTSNNTWGLAFTEEGDVVGSTANGNPSWHLTIPNRHFQSLGRKPQQVARADKNEKLAPITTDFFQNNPKGLHSSGAGHALYTARRFPESWWNSRALVCEPPMHLVTAPRYTNHGDRFEARGFENNLYASADAWSAPVAAEVGPDGAVWIADWYNPICNHNTYRKHHKQGKGNAFQTDDRDRSHGRIYRIYPTGTGDDPYPDLGSEEKCLKALAHPNLFWRLQAQWQLTLSAAPEELINAARTADDERTRLHLLLAASKGRLDGVQAAALSRRVDRSKGKPGKTIAELLDDSTAANLRRLSEKDRHPLDRKAAALRLVESPADPNLGGELAKLLLAEPELKDQKHLADAIRLAAIKHPEGFVRHLIESDVDLGKAGLERIARDIVSRFKVDQTVLSPGLLQLVRQSPGKLADLVKPAIGAKPPAVAQEQLSPSGHRGKEHYLACVACHQPDGQGLEGTFPPLAGSQRLLGDPAVPVKIVLKGLQGPLQAGGKGYNGVMPGHESLMDDQQIADVLSYVRSAWGNKAGDVSVESVKEIRAKVQDRKAPWSQIDLK